MIRTVAAMEALDVVARAENEIMVRLQEEESAAVELFQAYADMMDTLAGCPRDDQVLLRYDQLIEVGINEMLVAMEDGDD